MNHKLSDKVKRECIPNHAFPTAKQVQRWAHDLDVPANDDGEYSSPELTRRYVALFTAYMGYK